jgi:hypothetical protein
MNGESSVYGRMAMRSTQVSTYPVTIAWIVSQDDFWHGMAAFLDGRPLPISDLHWEFERGRLFAAAYCRDHPHASPLDLSRRELAALASRYFESGELL